LESIQNMYKINLRKQNDTKQTLFSINY